MTSKVDPVRVLAVGPHDVDSLGDLLFLLITEQYLKDAEVVAAAPFGADLTSLIDRQVHAYESLLDTEEFDVVWTTGGEIGGMDLDLVYRRVLPAKAKQEYEVRSRAEREQILERVAPGVDRVVSPYIPALAAYPLNAGAVSVINSVGISHILGSDLESLPEVTEAHRKELVALLRGITLVSIRDKESSDLLSGIDVEHRLAPDMVHALGVIRPAERDTGSDVAVLQFWAKHLTNVGPANVAQVVARCENLRRLRLRLVLAGKHDEQRAQNEELIRQVKQIAPGTDIEIIEDRRPLDLADHISKARVVVDFCELHVRLVANAYNVPRVSVKDPDGPKTQRYASRWDPGMPYEVPLDDLDAAIGEALSRADDPEVIEQSERVSRLAHDNLEYLATEALAAAAAQTPGKARRAAARQEYVSHG